VSQESSIDVADQQLTKSAFHASNFLKLSIRLCLCITLENFLAFRSKEVRLLSSLK